MTSPEITDDAGPRPWTVETSLPYGEQPRIYDASGRLVAVVGNAEIDLAEAANCIEADAARIAELEAALSAATAERDEARKLASLGCDANGGGEHSIIQQGSYKFCHRCGSTIKSPALHERARNAEARAKAAEAEAARLREALKAVRPVIQSLIQDEYNVETWGLRQRLAAIDAALAQPAPVKTDGVAAIAAERRRQVEAEGWTVEHDDTHANGEMAAAAVCYAFTAVRSPHYIHGIIWPWSGEWWKPGDKRRNLVKAGALIAAEIDRLDRAAQSAPVKGGE